MKNAIENDASLKAIVEALVGKKRGRVAIIKYCEEVMATKEITKRNRKTCDQQGETTACES